MRPVAIGLVLPLYRRPPGGAMPGWSEIREMATTAEDRGFDTVWIPDELLWNVESWGGSHGWWECVAVAGAVAAATTSIGIGTWVLAESRNRRAHLTTTARVVAALAPPSGYGGSESSATSNQRATGRATRR